MLASVGAEILITVYGPPERARQFGKLDLIWINARAGGGRALLPFMRTGRRRSFGGGHVSTNGRGKHGA